MNSILIIDDEAEIRKSLSGVLEDEGYSVSSADSAESCLALLGRKSFDLVLLDIWLPGPGMDGLECLDKIKSDAAQENAPEVVMISGHGSIETAVRATKMGAFDFLEKPLSLERTLIVVKNAVDAKKLREENRELKRQQSKGAGTIVGDSIPMKALRQQIGLMAPSNGRVLIYGESGSGKELVAHAIHQQSTRKGNLYVEVNCAAIPEDFIEAELFGTRRGAVAGGPQEKTGKFERADGGTLFLDEVGDMSLKTQSKVLRTLDEQRLTPVGSDDEITVDVRVVAATNKDLEEEIARGNFREDLFYRLNVVPFFVPPLRERKEDIPLLAKYFLKEISAEYGRKPREITDEAIDSLMRYSWPGNVRELRNVIERMVIMNPLAGKLDRKHLPTLVQRDSGRRPAQEFSTLHEARAAYERDYILRKMEENHGNISRTAEVLGLERSHMYRKMRALNISVKE
ncbi:MAG: sigma-54 dependent transcriptional regulator [Acidobacteriaceae bacterium]